MGEEGDHAASPVAEGTAGPRAGPASPVLTEDVTGDSALGPGSRDARRGGFQPKGRRQQKPRSHRVCRGGAGGGCPLSGACAGDVAFKYSEGNVSPKSPGPEEMEPAGEAFAWKGRGGVQAVEGARLVASSRDRPWVLGRCWVGVA